MTVSRIISFNRYDLCAVAVKQFARRPGNWTRTAEHKAHLCE